MIKEQCTSEMKGQVLSLRGTDVSEISDILADILVPFSKKVANLGTVSLGVWLQAEIIYKRHKEELFKHDYLKFNGHSLGAAIGVHVAIMLFLDGYKGFIRLTGNGGVKSLSPEIADWLFLKRIEIIWNVRHRDPIPFLGFWQEPNHWTQRSGNKRKHFLDFSLKEHMMY